MKQFFLICLLLSPILLFAQTSNEANAETPAAPISKSVTTTITTPAASMPGSNTNPTTGTVINLKKSKNTNSKGKNISNSNSIPAKPVVKGKKKKRSN